MIIFQAGVGHIVIDAHGEVDLRLGLAHLIEDALDHAGGELFGGQAVASANHFDLLAAALSQGIDHIQVQRLAARARLFGAV